MIMKAIPKAKICREENECATWEAAPEPGGCPSATDVVGAWDVVVMIMPDVSVIIRVARVGDGVIVGIADALMVGTAMRGLYVLVPKSDETICPTAVRMEVLKRYDGVAGIGVVRMKLGSVVGMVADAEEKKEDMSVAFSLIVVILLKGYKPIIGGSLSSMP